MELENYIKKVLRESFNSRIENQDEIDAILDKINSQNQSVSPKDRVRLDRLTNNNHEDDMSDLNNVDKGVLWLETIITDVDMFEENGQTFLNCERLGGFGIITPYSGEGKNLYISEQLIYVIRKKFRVTILTTHKIIMQWAEENLGINNIVNVEPLQKQV